jgi:RNA polymerase sigma-70 factor (ECF subfamily)
MNSEPALTTSGWMASVLERFEQRLIVYAQRIVGDHDEARDIVQDTFLKLCGQDPGQLNGRLAQWLYTVCRNRALDVRRRQRHGGTGAEADVAEQASTISREPVPSAAAADRDTLDAVLRQIGRLSVNQQECLRLKFQHELSYKEISEITNLSVSNVGFLIHTGLKTVRERMSRETVGFQPASAVEGLVDEDN